jgi:hypothetical protein
MQSAPSDPRSDDDANKSAATIRVGIARAPAHAFVDARFDEAGRIGEPVALVAADGLAAALG